MRFLQGWIVFLVLLRDNVFAMKDDKRLKGFHTALKARQLPRSLGSRPFRDHFLNFAKGNTSTMAKRISTENNQNARENYLTSLSMNGLTLRGGGREVSIQKNNWNAMEVAATSIFAASGAVTAGKKGMDLVGMIFVAFVTACTGRTVRDLVLLKQTVFWVQEPIYVYICLASAILSFLIWPRIEKRLYYYDWKVYDDRESNKTLEGLNAFALAVLTVLGTDKAMSHKVHPSMWIISGMFSSCLGSIARDILCQEKRGPCMLYPNRPNYTIPALLGSSIYTIFQTTYVEGRGTPFDRTLLLGVAFLVTFMTRMIIVDRRIRTPHWNKYHYGF